jgi:glutathione peroxidase
MAAILEDYLMKRLLAAISFLPSLLAPAAVHAADMASGSSASGSAFQFGFTSIDGRPMPLADFKGRALLVVNTASFCGYTNQYAGLQALHDKYEKLGLVVIGVPSNDFGEQEPKAETEIATFCQGAFGVMFPLTDKQAVKGPNAHPFYKWAVATLGANAAPKWNFHKYLIGRDGRLLSAFSTATKPQDPQVITAIEAALK